MWTWIKAFFLGVSRRIVKALAPYLVSEGARFAADAFPIALRAVEDAARLDLDGDGKYRHARRTLVRELHALGTTYRNRWLRQAIEMAYEAFSAQYAQQLHDSVRTAEQDKQAVPVSAAPGPN